MKTFLIVLLTLSLSLESFGQGSGNDQRKEIQVSVKNPLSRARENLMIFISESEIKKRTAFDPSAFVVLENGTEVPADFVIEPDKRGIAFVLETLEPGGMRSFIISHRKSSAAQAKRTQAELSHRVGGAWNNREYVGGKFQNVEYLRVPTEHKDHSWFIRYEGPGWESDKVGYRFYLDQRNATDVFGKLSHDMVLQGIGQDNFDSYHELQPWGMDIMKVGKSLGIGSIGAIDNKGGVSRVEKTDSVSCRITMNGNLYSSIRTSYFGWKVGDRKSDLVSQMSIHAGTRLTHQQLSLSDDFAMMCTGIVKDTTAAVIRDAGNKNAYGFLATYGKQSLNSDELGLVIFFRPEHFGEFTADEFSHIVKLKTTQNKLDYYFAAAWVREPEGIRDQKEFHRYVRETAEELAHPVSVKIAVKK